jgi:hypothetical protein
MVPVRGTILWGGVVMTFLVQGSPPARAEDVATVLARMREAAGSKALKAAGDVLIRGKSNEFDSAGEYSLRFTAAGKFLHKVDGPLGETHGFNGTTCWMVDKCGVWRTVELFDRDLWQLWVGLQTGQWLANAAPDDVALAPEGTDPGPVVLDVRQGRLKAKLHVSRTTWLPEVLRRTGVTGDQTWTFAGYRDDLGWKLPGKVAMKLGAGITHTYEVVSVSLAPAAGAGVYDPAPARPADARFDPDVSPRLEVRRTRTGHVLVHPRIDGTDLGWLIFDTGAGSSTVLHRGAVARLKLTPVGAGPITSVFGSTRCRILRGTSLEIGPMSLAKPFLVEMDLGFVQQALGKEVVGIIGYDLLSRCVAEIALADDTIKVYDPQRYPAHGAPWQRLTFNQWLPLVPAAFEGGKGLFRIDVGAAGGAFGRVVFHAPAVEEMQLLKGRPVTITKVGTARVAVGKIGWFELAGHRFGHPEVVFALDRQGPLGDEYVQGNLGVEFLKPFRIVLDYGRERVAITRTE